MGLNVDLTKMFGIRNMAKCPKCGFETEQWFTDYDIECGNPNPKPGQWSLMCCCEKCEHEFKWNFKVSVDL